MVKPIMKFGLLPGLAVVAMIIAERAQADDGSGSLDTIVVTASRLARSAGDLTQSVDIISADAIAARQPASVTELMRQLPGVNVIQQGGRGSITSLILRGGEPNFTVVLIDGVKANDSTNTRGGSYDFSYLDLASIDRIEIVRGPMSARYGSDALSGVVNIITDRGEPASGVYAEVGGHGRVVGRLTLGGALGTVRGEIGVHGTGEHGDIEGASYDDRGTNGWLRLPVGSNGEAGLVWRYQDAASNSFPEDSGGPELAVVRDVDERDVTEAHARAWLRLPFGDGWTSDVSLSRYDRAESSTSPGIAPGVFDGIPPVVSATDFVRDQLVVSARGELSASASVVVGGEWQREDGRSAGTIDFGFLIPTDFQLDRDTLSIFTEFEWRLQPAVVQASLRRDDPDGIDAVTSAQLGVLFALPDDIGDLRVSWGEGFKAPSFFALGHPLVGNPNLVSETATSIDIGYRTELSDDTALEFSLFRNEFENLIDFDPVLFTNVNRSKVVAQGAEASGSFQILPTLSLDAHLTYSDTDIRDSDARLRGRPKWRGGIVTNWQVNDAWQMSASLLTLDKFFDSSIATGGLFLDGYTRLDLAVNYRYSESLRFGFAVDNALDETFYEAVGFPAAGVRARVNASYAF